jgi:hypothetical protein
MEYPHGKHNLKRTFSISTTFWLEYPKEVSSAKSLLGERSLSPISFM